MTNPHPLEGQLPALSGSARIDALLNLAEHVRPVNAPRALLLSSEALQLAEALTDAPRRARSVLSVGLAHYRICAYSEARSCCTEALKQLQAVSDADGEARASLILGSIEAEQGHYALAIRFFREALAICDHHRLDDRRGIALNNLGLVHEQLGDYASALDYQLEGLVLIEARPSSEHRILIRVNLGNTLQRLGRLEEALTYHREAQVLACTAGNTWSEGLAWNNQGSVLHALGQEQDAVMALQTALPLLRSAGYRKGEAEAQDLLGEVHQALGAYTAALEHYSQAVALAVEIGAQEEEAQVRLHSGTALLQLGDLKGAQEALEASLSLSERLGRVREARDAHEQLVHLHETAGAHDRALVHHKHYHRLDRQMFNETQDRHTQRLLIQHDVEAQRHLNVQLQSSNVELALLNQQNQELLTRVQHQMLHDHLTGLPNRTLFEVRLRDALARAEVAQSSLAVLFLDLDGFKRVNDTLGHDAGDELLMQVATRFTAAVRADETVARLGGDEFVAVIGPLQGLHDALSAAQRFLLALDRPFDLRGQTVQVSASIGVSVYPEDGTDAASLQRRADEAMYQVKREGKRAVRLYASR